MSSEIGFLLKKMLDDRSLSMSKLSEETNIDKATISRIINHKRRATPDHLQRFANYFSVPISKLYLAAGYAIEQEEPSDIHASINSIQDTLSEAELYNKSFSTEDVKEHLTKYQQYSSTEEGQKIVQTEFKKKLEQVGGVGPYIHELKNMFQQFYEKKGSQKELAIIGGALIYFIFTVDVIPDYIFPIGYLDDAVAIKLALNALKV